MDGMVKDVHTRHCCKNCGCKYGEDQAWEFDGETFIGCSVVSGYLPQDKPCGKQYVCPCYEEGPPNLVK